MSRVFRCSLSLFLRKGPALSTFYPHGVSYHNKYARKPPGLSRGTFHWYNEKHNFCEVENEENFILGRESLNILERGVKYLNL